MRRYMQWRDRDAAAILTLPLLQAKRPGWLRGEVAQSVAVVPGHRLARRPAGDQVAVTADGQQQAFPHVVHPLVQRLRSTVAHVSLCAPFILGWWLSARYIG